jgi:hypothetical protein
VAGKWSKALTQTAIFKKEMERWAALRGWRQQFECKLGFRRLQDRLRGIFLTYLSNRIFSLACQLPEINLVLSSRSLLVIALSSDYCSFIKEVNFHWRWVTRIESQKIQIFQKHDEDCWGCEECELLTTWTASENFWKASLAKGWWFLSGWRSFASLLK